jgi:hypothetical protein
MGRDRMIVSKELGEMWEEALLETCHSAEGAEKHHEELGGRDLN